MFEARLRAWLHTLRYVLADAAPAVEVPVNEFADLSDDEFREAYLGQVTPEEEDDGGVFVRCVERSRVESVKFSISFHLSISFSALLGRATFTSCRVSE